MGEQEEDALTQRLGHAELIARPARGRGLRCACDEDEALASTNGRFGRLAPVFAIRNVLECVERLDPALAQLIRDARRRMGISAAMRQEYPSHPLPRSLAQGPKISVKDVDVDNVHVVQWATAVLVRVE